MASSVRSATAVLATLCACSSGMVVQAESPRAPHPPFTAQQAELGKELAAKSLDIRKQITNAAALAETFKIIGNRYLVGNANGEVFLLTSPQGHIMMGAGAADSAAAVQKNIESLGFKMTDIKAILVNHNHGDQSGGAAYVKEKTGAPLMAGFGEIPFIEHGMFNPPAIPAPPAADGRGGGRGGPPRYPPAHVDRALFDGDVVKVGPLSVTAYLIPGPSPSQRHSRTRSGRAGAIIRSWSLYPIDIFLELGAYAWGGTLVQPSGRITERMAKLKTDPKLFVNREIFNQFSAAREVEFDEKMAKINGAGQ